MGELGLHRVEVNIRPENVASLAVVRKLGFRDEGLRARYLHINGAWRDHRTFALTGRTSAGGPCSSVFTQTTTVTLATHRRASPEAAQGPNVVPVPPSSLIFLVVIAIWAAYFSNTGCAAASSWRSRSVDRFSESMRVLERRSP